LDNSQDFFNFVRTTGAEEIERRLKMMEPVKEMAAVSGDRWA
jgi:hypothetical protein